ncbi:MAG: uroporphyrinogen-III synthase [Pseudohongiellaceae bacterium]|nr:uroporphyrinogen-III synthase [Pseudohongiellaceae bacterium]
MKNIKNQLLNAQVVAIPESRQLDVLADLLLNRGAQVLRVPLVSILDAPDQGPIRLWLQQFIEHTPDYLVVLTGEGLRRLRSAAQREECEEQFLASLDRVSKICRGPKPGRVLRELSMRPDLLGKAPTSEGIIAALEDLDLSGKRVAVQLYGEEPNLRLINYLQDRGATVLPVSPYVYAPDADEEKVLALIQSLIAGTVTMMCFTSQPQLRRLQKIAENNALLEPLIEALNSIHIAAVGPIVARQLEEAGIRVSVMPESLYFMKPMVTELAKLVAQQPPQ